MNSVSIHRMSPALGIQTKAVLVFLCYHRDLGQPNALRTRSRAGEGRPATPSTMKNVLIVTYYFPPAGGPAVQRVLQHVRNLRSFGYNPIVLTVTPDDYMTEGSPLRCNIDASTLKDVPDDIEIHRVPSGQPSKLLRLVTDFALTICVN